MADCHHCGFTFPREMVVTRSLECPQCNRPVRCCKNCTFYAPGAHWDCRETIPEAVSDKERSNFCDYFRLSEASRGGTSQAGNDTRRRDARSDFDALFS